MRIAIIGAGNVGTALTTALTRAGHHVTITSRDPSDAARVARTTGADAAPTIADAVVGADVVIPAVPFSSLPQIASEIDAAAVGTPVVDVTNRISFGSTGPDIDSTSSNAEELAELLPKRPVVKAFNTLFASHQADPFADGIQLDGFVAGDDPGAKDTVLTLVESIGLNPVDVGPLARARQLEGLAFLNMALNIVHQGDWQSGWKLVAGPSTTHDDGGAR